MKKTYSNICKTLACDSLEANDDKVTLTTAQLDSIEADITAKYKDNTGTHNIEAPRPIINMLWSKAILQTSPPTMP